ncbi:peptide-methionine (S)-S-oxide reductase MsrA [Asticcacaulis sp. EMRT-3]|uniref:peptide-methionine (S)-S-oxide reductase MsrA n=1 Tax=Asticcacaulis sp. EMRT-3 TaxID=3040349 RepID=UPI0024AFE0B1|nr:peptide-methionine (S)-S-oxide reductase MsrA [Asticcacaulis sp. EMRT-3]MDI7776093.1 peptide-methionine (S)-S-oxide reductase MsrA [Asticcacaulis sp. EMRT-3]
MFKKSIFAAAAALMLSTTALTAQAASQVAVFAGGCFWSMQKAFDHVAGVTNTRAGFMGGHVKNPTYEEVVTETTGHVEAVEVTYDPDKVTYQQLLDTFWHHTDPTNPDGVICDFGSSYRTAIFTYNNDQYKQAVASKAAVGQQLNKPIATLIVKSTATGLPFYPASDYHQHFWKTHAAHYEAYYQGCGRGPALHKLWGNLAD